MSESFLGECPYVGATRAVLSLKPQLVINVSSTVWATFANYIIDFFPLSESPTLRSVEDKLKTLFSELDAAVHLP